MTCYGEVWDSVDAKDSYGQVLQPLGQTWVLAGACLDEDDETWKRVMLEVTIRGPDLEILGTGSWTLGGRKKGNREWVRTSASSTGVRAKHGRSGDPGLWVRNKEQ